MHSALRTSLNKESAASRPWKPGTPAELLSSDMQLVKGDIQSADLIGHLLTQHNIDTVMHFAAPGGKSSNLRSANPMSYSSWMASALLNTPIQGSQSDPGSAYDIPRVCRT